MESHSLNKQSQVDMIVGIGDQYTLEQPCEGIATVCLIYTQVVLCTRAARASFTL